MVLKPATIMCILLGQSLSSTQGGEQFHGYDKENLGNDGGQWEDREYDWGDWDYNGKSWEDDSREWEIEEHYADYGHDFYHHHHHEPYDYDHTNHEYDYYNKHSTFPVSSPPVLPTTEKPTACGTFKIVQSISSDSDLPNRFLTSKSSSTPLGSASVEEYSKQNSSYVPSLPLDAIR